MPEAQPARLRAEASVPATDAEVARLVRGLASDRWSDRRAAEDGLAGIGATALPALVGALRSDIDAVRWGAVKVLGEIGDLSSVSALVVALEDADGGVRWLAAQALISAGSSALVPILHQLLTGADSPWLQEGAHHVLRSLDRPEVRRVVRALEDRFPDLTVPVAANEALKALEPEQLTSATGSEANTRYL